MERLPVHTTVTSKQNHLAPHCACSSSRREPRTVEHTQSYLLTAFLISTYNYFSTSFLTGPYQPLPDTQGAKPPVLYAYCVQWPIPILSYIFQVPEKKATRRNDNRLTRPPLPLIQISSPETYRRCPRPWNWHRSRLMGYMYRP